MNLHSYMFRKLVAYLDVGGDGNENVDGHDLNEDVDVGLPARSQVYDGEEAQCLWHAHVLGHGHLGSCSSLQCPPNGGIIAHARI